MEQFSLTDRTALVTGGASGIGLAAAQRFLEAGAEGGHWRSQPG